LRSQRHSPYRTCAVSSYRTRAVGRVDGRQ
jgi:hypothetical protein